MRSRGSYLGHNEQGANLILDGRGAKAPAYPNGNWLGPTILTNVRAFFSCVTPFLHVHIPDLVFLCGAQVTTDMDCYKEEIFGPVLVRLPFFFLGHPPAR